MSEKKRILFFNHFSPIKEIMSTGRKMLLSLREKKNYQKERGQSKNKN